MEEIPDEYETGVVTSARAVLFTGGIKPYVKN